ILEVFYVGTVGCTYGPAFRTCGGDAPPPNGFLLGSLFNTCARPAVCTWAAVDRRLSSTATDI
ncbi:hypothetical protein HAX54_000235, partial [Datura stramonium]|nr:hypothetical protein [Datura stramonium]